MSTKALLFLALSSSLVTAFQVPRVVAQAAQKSAPEFTRLRALKDDFERQRRDLDRREIAALTNLAKGTSGAEADAIDRELFSLAITRELFAEAREAADRCLARKTTDRAVRALATLVQVVAKGEEGRDEEVISRLVALFTSPGKVPKGHAPESDMGLAVAEGYLQRLIRLGRYDAARKLCAVMCDEDEAPESVKEHFETRMAPLALLGKRAPAIEGIDVEGQRVSLADWKGMVVLIDFWATWCPPCVAEIPMLKTLAATHGDQGLVILGVNVDARHEDVKEMTKALPVVRRFLAQHEVTWTNLLDGDGAADFAKAYGVKEIPATFLVGRDGTIVAVELSDGQLENQVIRALGHNGNAPFPLDPGKVK